MGRYELTDAQWERLEPLLPPEKPRTGRPNHSHRRMINGMLWIARSGAPWRDLPERYGAFGTVASRFYRWRHAGAHSGGIAGPCRPPGSGRLEASFRGQLDCSRSSARGWRPEGQRRKKGIDGEALGRSRGGFSTKIHIRAEGLGKPVTFSLTGGEVHDSKAFATLMGSGWIKRLGRGRPRLKPERLAADKAYSSGVIRSALRRRGIQPVIPTKSNERPDPTFDRDAYRERNRVERLINKLKQFRRIATRYEKRAANYLAMITIVATLLWL
ncbi:IS5 family transposase [Azospirillum brasilense]|uniref:IS5 family transposase n=1 Tax=Azospirillum brasilense TaxID=192 RepID=UPI0020003026|nr:IS5 family transposase [Azospirillum brasilense]